MRTDAAVRHGITVTAGVVTSAALVMVGVFWLFGTLSSLEIKPRALGQDRWPRECEHQRNRWLERWLGRRGRGTRGSGIARRVLTRKTARGLWALLAGAGGAFVTIYDRGNLNDAAEENTSELIALQVGWGLNLAMGASVVLGVVGLVALLGNQDAPGMKVAPEVSKAPDTKPAVTPHRSSSAPSNADEIEALADLRSRGVLTDDEFRVAKERLLDST